MTNFYIFVQKNPSKSLLNDKNFLRFSFSPNYLRFSVSGACAMALFKIMGAKGGDIVFAKKESNSLTFSKQMKSDALTKLPGGKKQNICD